jgi:hypothetical protein
MHPGPMESKPVRGSIEEGGQSKLNEHAWIRDRELEVREKERRGEELSHAEKMSLAIDEGVQ